MGIGRLRNVCAAAISSKSPALQCNDPCLQSLFIRNSIALLTSLVECNDGEAALLTLKTVALCKHPHTIYDVRP